MGQLGFFDADKRLQALSARGDPLEAIDHSDSSTRSAQPSAVFSASASEPRQEPDTRSHTRTCALEHCSRCPRKSPCTLDPRFTARGNLLRAQVARQQIVPSTAFLYRLTTEPAGRHHIALLGAL